MAIEYAKYVVEKLKEEKEVEVAPHELPLLNELLTYIFRKKGEVKTDKISRYSVIALALEDFVRNLKE